MKLLFFLLPLFVFSQEIPKDKQLHLLGGGALAFPSYALGKELRLTKAENVLFTTATTTLFGILKEWHDTKTTGFDWEDVGYTAAGGFVVSLTISIFDKK